MLRSLVLILVLLVGLASPAAAQQLTQQEARQAAEKIVSESNRANQAKDAAALAALYTTDAILVTPQGLVVGPEAIEKQGADGSGRWNMADPHGGVERDAAAISLGTRGKTLAAAAARSPPER